MESTPIWRLVISRRRWGRSPAESPHSFTVEIFPRFGRFPPKTWEYLYSERVGDGGRVVRGVFKQVPRSR